MPRYCAADGVPASRGLPDERHSMPARSRRRFLAAGLGAGLTSAFLTGALVAPSSPAQATARAGSPGYCPTSLGVTVVVDDQDLGTGRAVVRCAPPQHAGAPFTGTALQALVAAGFAVTGTTRSGDAVVCRLQGRPAANETLPIPGDPAYRELCADTPPDTAAWASWRSADGGPWTRSSEGAAARQVTGGSFEGWSFSHVTTAGTTPADSPPRVAPRRRATDTSQPTPAPTPTQTATPTPTRTTAPVTTPPPAATATTAPLLARTSPSPAATATAAAATSHAGSSTPTTKSTSGVDPAGTSYPAATAGMAGDPAAARDWLIRQLQPAGTMPAAFGDGADYGLTVDTLWALQATGASSAALGHTWSALSTPEAVSDFTGPGFYSSIGMPGARFGGQSGKLLLAAATMGADVTHVGGRNLRQQTLDLVAASGPQRGRIRDVGTGSDNTNIISQSLGVIGLSATGPVPAQTVNYLLSQQCSRGYFRMYNNDNGSCDGAAPAEAAADNDGTALGVQALIAAKSDGADVPQEAIDRGAAYLASVQRPDGSFGGGVGTEGANTNSTGLAAATLKAGGDPSSAARALAWVASLQATAGVAAGTRLSGDVGAIAYDANAWADGLRHGLGAAGDQWRRATAQAVFALSPHTFAELVDSPPAPGPGPTGPPSPTSSTTTSPSPSTTGPTPTTSFSSSTSSTSTSSAGPTGLAPGPSGATSGSAGGSDIPSAGPTADATTPNGPPSTTLPTATPANAGADTAGGTRTAVPIARRQNGTASSGSTRSAQSPSASALTEAGGAVRAGRAAGAGRSAQQGQGWLGMPPVLWAVLAGLLLGAVVVAGPRMLPGRGRHAR